MIAGTSGLGTADPPLVLSRLCSQNPPSLVCCHVGAARCVSGPWRNNSRPPFSQISKCTKHSHARSHRHAVCYKIRHLSLSFDSFLALRSPLEDCFPGLGVAPAAVAIPVPAAPPPAAAPPLFASSLSEGSCWPCCTNRAEGQKSINS